MDPIIYGVLRRIILRQQPVQCTTELKTNITLLNDSSQTYISDTTGSMTNLDLTSVDQRSALLFTWKVEREPWNSDHVPISIEYMDITEP
jgi:hypothetical protein